MAARAWESVVEYTPPYRFQARTEPGERLDWRAVLVVVDGLRLDASHKMPNLDRLRGQGASLAATAGIPSYSRPGRANLVTGASPEIHGATTNQRPRTLAIDNLFRGVAHTNGHVAVAGSELWRGLFGPDLAGASLFLSPVKEEPGRFERVAPKMISFEWQALRFVLEQKARLAILDLVVPDYAAHDFGARAPQYARAVIEADRVIGTLVDEVDLWRTLVVVTADHGHLAGGGHGGSELEVLEIPLVIAGRGVRAGASGGAGQIDVAPTIAALLGLPIPAASEGRVLSEIFDPKDPPPGYAPREAAQQAAFVRGVADSLGISGATSVGQARRLRAEADRRSRLALFLLGLVAPPLALLMAHRRSWRLSLAAAVLGALAYESAFRLLVAWAGIRLSLSSIQHDEDVAPYFGRLLLYSAIAAAAALWAVALGLGRLRGSADRARLGLAAASGAALLLWADVLFTYRDQGLIMAWTVSDFARGFDAFVDLVRLQAVGYAAVLALPLAWILRQR